MSRQPQPNRSARPALLRLALWLAPEARRPWLEDMAAEHPFVPAAERPGWVLAAVGLALRWRVASWGGVPRAQLAITVMALALLAASPWLLREYVLNTLTPVTESGSVDDLGLAEAQPGPAEEAADQARLAPEAPPAAMAQAATDEDREQEAATADLPAPAPVENAAEPADGGFRDRVEAAGVGADEADPVGPGDGEAAGREDEQRREADLEPAHGVLERQVVVVAEASLTLELLRPTRLVLIAGSDDAAEPYLDRPAETGERILVLPPVVVMVEDGGAVAVEGSGPLGEDGRPATRIFTPEGCP